MASKKAANGRQEKAKPMPSLIFNEGILNDGEAPEIKKAPEPELEIPVGDLPNPYNPKAARLMWVGVITLTAVIFFFWSWSLVYRFSSLKWSKTPEVSFYEATRQSWRNSFQRNNNSNTDLKNDIKANLEKLFAGGVTTTSASIEIPTSSATSS